MKDPSTWRLSHCFSSMAKNAARSGLARELNKMDRTKTMEDAGPDSTGTPSWLGTSEVVLRSIVRTVKLILS